jgi:hypothetical protein
LKGAAVDHATLTAILSLTGVAIGAGLQYYFGRNLEGRKQLAMQRAQAYVDYFKGVALTAQHGRSKDHLAMVADAKTRICLYGSPKVIQSLSTFESSGAVLTSAESQAAMMILLKAMRDDTGMSAAGISEEDFQKIIFGPSRPEK